MIRRVILVLIVLGVVYFSVQAGEFSSLDILHQRNRKAALQAQVDSLQRQIDSLRRVERAVRTDPRTQERIAREQFGLVKGSNEILYKFASPTAKDTTTK